MKFLLVALLLSTSYALQSVPTFELDLDVQPQNRWDGAVKLVVDLHGWNNSFGPVLQSYLPAFSFIPVSVTQQLSTHLNTSYPEVYGELTGIGQQLAEYGCSECTTSLMYVFAYFYELSHADFLRSRLPASFLKSCTGILSLPANVSLDIIHGRNMDESPHEGRNMTLNIRVTRSGVYQYSMVDWTWLTAGIATTSRRGGVTMEMNWNNDGPTLSLETVVARILQPATIPVLQLFRVVNDRMLEFDAAIKLISTAQFASPFYNIVSGTNRRGAVLTIQFNSTGNRVEFINSTNVTFMVQTNYDRWLPDPSDDPRRTVAENTLAMVGRDRSGTELGVWMALGVYPVHNPQTLFTALLSVNSDPEVYVREAMYPAQY